MKALKALTPCLLAPRRGAGRAVLQAGSMTAPDPDREAPALPDRHRKTHFGHKHPKGFEICKTRWQHTHFCTELPIVATPFPSRAFITSTFQRGSCPKVTSTNVL